MKRELSFGEVFLLPLAFAAGAAGLACSLVLFFEDREALALSYAVGGVALALWVGARAVLPPR